MRTPGCTPPTLCQVSPNPPSTSHLLPGPSDIRGGDNSGVSDILKCSSSMLNHTRGQVEVSTLSRKSLDPSRKARGRDGDGAQGPHVNKHLSDPEVDTPRATRKWYRALAPLPTFMTVPCPSTELNNNTLLQPTLPSAARGRTETNQGGPPAARPFCQFPHCPPDGAYPLHSAF